MLKNLFNIRPAHAHCDVPCGIYDPSSAQIAAVSVCRFLDQIAEVEGQLAENPGNVSALAKLSRLVAEKETHAAKVKSDIVVIWGDYIKAPQIEQFPDVHNLAHQIMLKGSACKVETSVENGKALLDLVNQFAEIFWATKGVETQLVTSVNPTGLAIVQPVLKPAS